MSRPALGLIETTGLAGAIRATHAATRAAEVNIASAERTEGGRVTVKIEGDWSAVQEAVEAGARAADEAGALVSMHVIPRTDNGIREILPYQQFVDRYVPGQAVSRSGKKSQKKESGASQPKLKPPTAESKPQPRPEAEPQPVKPVSPQVTLPPPPSPEAHMESRLGMEDLEKLPVVNLRRYARSITGLPIKGRQISIANKQQLLEAIRSIADRE